MGFSGTVPAFIWVAIGIIVGHLLRIPLERVYETSSRPYQVTTGLAGTHKLENINTAVEKNSSFLPEDPSLQNKTTETTSELDRQLATYLPHLFTPSGSKDVQPDQINTTSSLPSNKGKYAIITAVVKTPAYWYNRPNRRASFFNMTYCLLRSARQNNSTLPFHLIYGGGLTDLELDSLRNLGYIINDFSNMSNFFQNIYHPVYSVYQAYQEKRLYLDPTIKGAVQGRKDGWATYFKYLTWTFTQYERVIFIDTDVIFHENPDQIFGVEELKGLEFQAFAETAKRNYVGLNTHLMYVKPDLETFRMILDTADRGQWIPYTNTEQDVLEWIYPPKLFTKVFKKQSIKHKHGQKSCIV